MHRVYAFYPVHKHNEEYVMNKSAFTYVEGIARILVSDSTTVVDTNHAHSIVLCISDSTETVELIISNNPVEGLCQLHMLQKAINQVRDILKG
jgi:hypothetical protein